MMIRSPLKCHTGTDNLGIDPRTYLRDVLLRIGTEADVTTLTPHGWKERWESVVNNHRADILQRLVGQADAAD